MRIWQLLLGFTYFLAGCTIPITPITVQNSNTLHYHRTGGFAGAEMRAQIDLDDGHSTISRPPRDCERQLSLTELQTLTNLLLDFDFATLDANYFPNAQSADLMHYRIEYQNHAVETRDTAIPADLIPIIEYLEALSCNVEQGS